MARRGRGAGSTPATTALDRLAVAYVRHPYDHDPRVSAEAGYGAEAARALGVAPERVLKTLLVEVDSGSGVGRATLAVGIVPVSAQLDLKALARALGVGRVAMADVALAERVTGYVSGGISPVGQKRTLATVLDESAVRHASVLVSGGRRGLDIELAPADLVSATSATVAAIAR